MKLKTCKCCKVKFEPSKALQQVCSWQCGINLARDRRENTEAKKVKKELREAKDKIKSRQEWLKDAQNSFNAWIRYRDKDLPCISCQRHHDGQYHAGHYRTTKAAPELRFEERNVHKQCSVCNNHLSGNILEYRINLIKRIGLANVEWLEGPHEPMKYTIQDLKEIKASYKQALKDLQRSLTLED